MWRDETGGWSQEHELAAAQIETTDMWGRVLAQMWGAKPTDLPEPVRVEHPGRERSDAGPRGRVVSSIDDIAAFFARNK